MVDVIHATGITAKLADCTHVALVTTRLEVTHSIWPGVQQPQHLHCVGRDA